MRINLVAPFAEKDTVKALGGRGDAAEKCWYIVDVADLTLFARWIPDMSAATDASGGTPQMTKFARPTLTIVQETSVNNVADCGCDVLPWDDCVHTARAQDPW